MDPIDRWADDYFHPSTEEELRAILARAHERADPVRVRGSAHSEPAAIFSDATLAGRTRGSTNLMLDRSASFAIDPVKRLVTARAGCRFGFDPRDPTGRSTEQSGLCSALDAAGLALPLLGGISHQTIAGFLSTGSEGGSLAHSVSEQVAEMTLIDARGEVHHLRRGEETFEAAGVSLGTFGVISSVTLDCVDRYDLTGEERITKRKDAELDITSDGPDGLAAFLEREPYARLLWWPQPGIDKLVVWKARPASGMTRRPYEAFPKIAGSRLPMQFGAGLALRAIGARPRRLEHSAAWIRRVAESVLGLAYNAFVPTGEVQTFSDSWHHAIPLDDQMDERAMPVHFTEIWVPLDSTAEFMRRLAQLFGERGYGASANFAFEIYGGKRSKFWMSPGYGRDSVRLNIFWLRHNRGRPAEDFFPQFWDLSRSLDARLHWGKVLDPRDGGLAARFPRHREFLERQRDFDPKQQFLTEYWRHHLGLETRAMTSVPSALAPELEAPRRPLFGLRPADVSFVDEAQASFEVGFTTTASPERCFEAFRTDPSSFLSDMRAFRPLTSDGPGVGAVADEEFSFMTVRVRVVAEDPGRRWVAAVDACSLPLAVRMLEDVHFEPVESGTRVRWTVLYDPLPQVALFEPMVRPGFRYFFGRLARAFKRHLDAESP